MMAYSGRNYLPTFEIIKWKIVVTATRPRRRQRNRLQDEVREDGRIVGGEE
jgi:hypothetical protein